MLSHDTHKVSTDICMMFSTYLLLLLGWCELILSVDVIKKKQKNTDTQLGNRKPFLTINQADQCLQKYIMLY